MLISQPKLFKKLFYFLFPAGCLLCAKLHGGKGLICDKCEESLISWKIIGNRCPKCSRPSVENNVCCFCVERKAFHSFDWVEALFLYKDEVRNFIIRFKFNQQFQLSWVWATLIYEKAKSYLDRGFIIIPVPGNRKHGSFTAVIYHLKRMTSQLELLLYKRPGVAQKKLTGEQRLTAVRGRIYLKGRAPNKALLIDDVYTTGATLGECARVLKQNGSCEVGAIVLAIDPVD